MEIKSLVILFFGIIAVAETTPLQSSFALTQNFMDRDFNAEMSTIFNMLTPENSQNPINFNLSQIPVNYFNRNRKTMILVHGFSSIDYMTPAFKKACFEDAYHDVNIIGVDWTAGSCDPVYMPSANRVESVGEVIAKFIGFAVQNGLIDLNKLELIGHSLGAHSAGFVGKHLRHNYRLRLPLIVGLDPAGPLFREHNNKLHRSDAQKVIAIHTNDDYGHLEPFGGVDIYLNGGRRQPGLNDQESHCFAAEFYKGLINIQRPLVAHKYSSFRQIANSIVPKTGGVRLFHGKPIPEDGSLYYIDSNTQKHLLPEFEKLDILRDPPPSSFRELQQCASCIIS